MKCKHARKMLADYADETLGAADSQLVQEHIAGCDTCRQELDKLRKVLRRIDDVKVEYPQASVWENFLPDLHRRIEKEAALVFNKQRRQQFYLMPGWTASIAAIVLILFSAIMLRQYPFAEPIQPQIARSTITAESSSRNVTEYASEPMLVADAISKVLITETEAAELKKLKNFIQSETSTIRYQYYDVISNISGEESSAEDDEGFIQFLLENRFSEYDEIPVMGTDESGTI